MMLPRRGIRRTIGGGVPRIDWSNPLTDGLIGCYVPGVTGGYNLTGLGANLTPGSAGNAFVTTKEGAAWTTASASGGFSTASAPAAWKTGNATLYMRGYNSSTTNANYIFGVFYGTGTNPYYVVSIGVPNASPNVLQAQWNTGGTYTTGSNSTKSPGTFFSYGATFAVGGNVLSYLNGVQAASNSFGASAPNNTGTDTLSLFTTQPIDLLINIALAWNYPLTAAQVAALDADPYQFLIWPEDEIFALLKGSLSVVSSFGSSPAMTSARWAPALRTFLSA